MIKLCEFYPHEKWKLIYRATEHGFSANSFHEKCDKIKKTLILIKSTTNYIFGGYTNAEWSSDTCWNNDPNAFLFSLTNNINKPKIIHCLKPQYATISNQSYGPIFGGGNSNSLIITDMSNLNANSSHYLSDYYIDRDHPYLLNAGNSHFQTIEIEIYAKC